MSAAEVFDASLVSSRPLTPAVRELVFERLDGKPLLFQPGQWVNLVLPLPTGEVKRAYSIASAPDNSSRFEIAVTRVLGGPGSEYLHGLQEGQTLRAIGPQGFFTRPAGDTAPALFVATGTGFTPLRSMMQAALREGSRTPMWLLFGARHEQDILYRDELEEWSSAIGHVRYEVTLSRPLAAWTGRRGYVQAHVPELFRALAEAAAPALPHVYICGLERMVSVVRELVRHDLGADRKHVHTERYD